MTLATLQQWLLSNSGFQSQLSDIVTDSVGRQFPMLDRSGVLSGPGRDWQYMLLCASVLATGTQEGANDAALRIAQHCLVDREAGAHHKDAAAVILDTLVNRRAIRLAEVRHLLAVHFIDRLPPMLRLDCRRRALQYRVTLASGEVIDANRFQHRFWQSANEVDWLSISAPTSAGKSYVIKRWIEDRVRSDGSTNIIYVVPTRALIQEVEDDLRQCFHNAVARNVVVSSVPSEAIVRHGCSHVLVFTQERLHLFLTRVASGFIPHVLVIDEAQKIGDRHRGILLQQVLDLAVRRNAAVKVVFASPLTANPEALLEDAPVGRATSYLASDEVTVNQNLLWVSQVARKPKQWKVTLRTNGGAHQLGMIDLANSPGHISKRLTFVAYAMSGAEGGSIVYVNTAAEAEKAALQLADLSANDNSDDAHDQDIEDLIELVRETIHPQYVLRTVLKRRIAFHYGNMPLLIRKEIERLFREGALRYLVCTSTLLEGVNLPCRSVYVRGPRKGKTQPMSPSDFWNLAGRAGRWGKEFQGNIVCIDPTVEVWREELPEKRVKQHIKTTAERIREKHATIAAFLDAGTPRELAAKDPELEYLASYLEVTRRLYGTLSDAPIGRRTGAELAGRLDESLRAAFENADVPSDILSRNPGISPLAIKSLADYFSTREGAPEELVPSPPESNDAALVYTKVFGRINAHVFQAFGGGGRVFQCGMLVVNWMRGYPLSRLITSWLDYLDRKGRSYNIASEIRRTMEDVETVARFRAPKYLSCYLDVLTHHLQRIGREELLEGLPNFSLLLEFGVSQKTQMSLMSLGLSRASTIAVSELIARDDLGVEEALVWLRSQEWESIDLPALIKRDVRRAIELVQPPAAG